MNKLRVPANQSHKKSFSPPLSHRFGHLLQEEQNISFVLGHGFQLYGVMMSVATAIFDMIRRAGFQVWPDGAGKVEAVESATGRRWCVEAADEDAAAVALAAAVGVDLEE